MKSTNYIRASEREELIASFSTEAKRVIRAVEARCAARVRTLERSVRRAKEREKRRSGALKRDKIVLDARHRRARKTANEREKKIRELKNMLRLYTDMSESLITVVCDHVKEGLSLRAACRLAHVRYGTLDRMLADARAKGEQGTTFQQFLVAAIEEALGHNEKLWVDKAKKAMDDDVVELGEGATFKRGDGKLAMMMLERQHSKDYSPRHVVVAEDNRVEEDLSDLSDEDLATKRAYEEMLERRSRMGGGKAMVGFLPPPNNSHGAESIPVDAEVEDA